ncbi:hypothetical protein BC829DRAFT_422052 [Chytridium lagenaria]|nr:hypothetical protein BC829DRAFT_422052 [Chytridium lagenaria]
MAANILVGGWFGEGSHWGLGGVRRSRTGIRGRTRGGALVRCLGEAAGDIDNGREFIAEWKKLPVGKAEVGAVKESLPRRRLGWGEATTVHPNVVENGKTTIESVTRTNPEGRRVPFIRTKEFGSLGTESPQSLGIDSNGRPRFKREEWKRRSNHEAVGGGGGYPSTACAEKRWRGVPETGGGVPGVGKEGVVHIQRVISDPPPGANTGLAILPANAVSQKAFWPGTRHSNCRCNILKGGVGKDAHKHTIPGGEVTLVSRANSGDYGVANQDSFIHDEEMTNDGTFLEQDCLDGGAIMNVSDAEAGAMTNENTASVGAKEVNSGEQ